MLLSIFVFGALVVLLAFLVDWEIVINELRLADWRYLGLGLFCLVVGYLAYACRWRLTLNNQPKFSPTFHSGNIANMINCVIPMRPGDIARIIILGEDQNIPLAKVTSSIIVERWFEQVMRLAALIAAIAFGASDSFSTLTILSPVIFIVLLFAIMIWIVKRQETVLRRWPAILAKLPKVSIEGGHKALAGLLDGLGAISSPKIMIGLLLWSFFMWGWFWAFHYLTLLGTNIKLDINSMMMISLGSLAMAPPSSSTLPGIYHVSIVGPLSLAGYDPNRLTTYAILLNALYMTALLFLGLFGFSQVRFSAREFLSRIGGDER